MAVKEQLRALLPWLLLVTLLAAGVALYLRGQDFGEERTVFGNEALAEPFLAAQRFAAQFDIDIQQSHAVRYDALPPVDRVLIVTGPGRPSRPDEVVQVLDWIQNGGHLIVVAHAFWDDASGSSGDMLLDYGGVRLMPATDVAAEVAVAEPVPTTNRRLRMMARGPGADCGAEAGLTAVPLDGETDALMSMPWRRALLVTDEAATTVTGSAANRAGAQVLQMSSGAGMLTVLTSSEQWVNDFIHCHDHAHVLRHLLGDGTRVVWVDRIEMPGLLTLLWENFAVALTLLAVALALWLWRALVRPGPVLAPLTEGRRALLEHVDGAAQFLWQQRSADALLTPLRDDVSRRIAVRARRAGQDEDAYLKDIAHQSGVSLAQANAALANKNILSRAAFDEAVATLQRLRSQL